MFNSDRAIRATDFVASLRTQVINGKIDKDGRLLTRAYNIDVEYLSCVQNNITGQNAMRLIDDISYSPNIQLIDLFELDPELDYIMLDKNDNACMLLRKPDRASLYQRLAQNGYLTLKHKMLDHMRRDMKAMREDQEHEWKEMMNGIENEALTKGLRL
jgi:hypothetical protein